MAKPILAIVTQGTRCKPHLTYLKVNQICANLVKNILLGPMSFSIGKVRFSIIQLYFINLTKPGGPNP